MSLERTHEKSSLSVNDKLFEKNCTSNMFDNSDVKNIGLKCMSTNTDTLNNKLELLETFIFQEKIDVIAVQEIHNKNDNQELKDCTKFILPGFHCLKNNTGRGVCLFIKENEVLR